LRVPKSASNVASRIVLLLATKTSPQLLQVCFAEHIKRIRFYKHTLNTKSVSQCYVCRHIQRSLVVVTGSHRSAIQTLTRNFRWAHLSNHNLTFNVPPHLQTSTPLSWGAASSSLQQQLSRTGLLGLVLLLLLLLL